MNGLKAVQLSGSEYAQTATMYKNHKLSHT